MSGLTDRLERDLREIAAGADPSPSAWNAIVAQLGDVGESEVALVIAPAPERWKRSVRIASSSVHSPFSSQYLKTPSPLRSSAGVAPS